MVSSALQPPDSSQESTITFPCDKCGSVLSIGASQTGVSGPCPVCGALLTSPAVPAKPGNAARPPASDSPPDALPSQHSRKHVPIRARARIAPDSIVDQAHLQNRESAQTLRVLALFILTLCACLAAAWFLKNHLSR